MNFELFVGLRFLFGKRRQTFISLITIISIVGVAVGVTALIVVQAVMNGFQEDLRERILGVTAHIQVGYFDGNMPDYQRVLEQVRRDPGVVDATPYVYTQVMLSSGRSIAGAVMRGLDPEGAHQLNRLDRTMETGRLQDLIPKKGEGGQGATPGIILGTELAKHLVVGTGDAVTVISPVGRLTPMGRMPKSTLFRVVGTFKSGMYEYDNTLAYVDLKVAQGFLGIGDTVSRIEINVDDIYQAKVIADRFQTQLKYPFWVRDWMQMNRNLFSALKLEKAAMFIILTLIVLVAAFNIVSSLIMMVMDKTHDIAILKAMGATTGSIRKVFVLNGFVIGIMGTFFGLLGGLGLCRLLKEYQFIDLPADVYNLSKLPVQMNTADVVIIALSAVAISLVATLYPSGQAAKLDPAEALRYE